MACQQHRAKKMSKYLVGLSLALSLCSQALPAAELLFTVTDLGANFQPTAISDSGDIVGLDTSIETPAAVRYTGSGLELLGNNMRPNAININGITVGHELTEPSYRALSWLNGQLSAELNLFSNLSEARSINGGDEIVGSRLVDGQYQRIFIFDSFTSSLTTLETLGGANAWANAINSSGFLTGGSENGLGNSFAIRFDGETLESLSSLPGYQHSDGVDINDINSMVGSVYNRDEERSGKRAVLARQFQGLINLGTLDNDIDSIAHGVDNNTSVIGQSIHSSGRQRAFIYDSSTAASLIIRVDPTSSTTVYTGSTAEGGVNRSANRGLDSLTINNGLDNTSINDIIIDPDNNQTIYLGTDKGAYVSTNGGNSWGLISNDLEELIVYAMHIDPNNLDILYAGTNKGIYFSNDLGKNWTVSPETTGFSAASFTNAIGEDAIFAASSKGLQKSTNQGKTWSIHNGLDSQRLFIRNISDVAIDPNSNPPAIYVASLGGGVYRSTEQEPMVLWERLSTGLNTRQVYDILIDDSVDPSIIYTSGQRGMYQLIRDANEEIEDEWQAIKGFDRVGVFSMALANEGNTQYLYATTLSGGAFRSSNDQQNLGDSWTSITSGITIADVYDFITLTDPNTRKSKVIAASSNGIYSAAINGETTTTVDDDGNPIDTRTNISWSPPSAGGSGIKLTTLVKNDNVSPAQLWAGSSHNGIYLSETAGENWFNITKNLDNLNIQDLEVDTSGQPAVVYAATLGGVYRSDDGGYNWQNASGGLASISVLSLALDSVANPQILYAGTIDGVFRSTDQGRNWAPVNQGLENIDITELFIDPLNNDHLIAASGSAGLFRSLNRGQHWENINQGLSQSLLDIRIHDIIYHPVLIETLLVATQSGVYEINNIFCNSSDNCWDWTVRNSGIENLPTYTITINPDNTNEYIIGVDKLGAYKSLDSGESWVQIENGLTAEIIRMLDINTLLDNNNEGWVLKDAIAINNSGQIVGEGEIDGNKHGFLLTPILGALSTDLQLEMFAQPNVLKPDIPMTYEITITNIGPETATGIQLTSWLPPNTLFLHTSSNRGRCSKDAEQDIVRCKLDSIGPGGEIQITIALQPTVAELNIHNIARVTSNEHDTDLSNNTQGLNSPVTVDRCFIATAAYGSLLHPYVTELRNFRDKYLLTHAPGRYLVSQYYHFSPPLADYIRNNEIARSLTQLLLTPIVYAVIYPSGATLLLISLGGLLYYRRRSLAY